MSISINETESRQAGTVREMVGVFNDQEHLQNAVDELQENGIDRSNLSTLASPELVAQRLGYVCTDVSELEDNAQVPRSVYVSKVSLGDAEGLLIGLAVYVPTLAVAAALSSQGAAWPMLTLGAVIAGAIGGLAGWMMARKLDRFYLRRIQDQVRQGGIVLWVGVHSQEQELRAGAILERTGARHVHAHDLPIMVKPMPGWRGVSYNMSFMKLLGL